MINYDNNSGIMIKVISACLHEIQYLLSLFKIYIKFKLIKIFWLNGSL